MTRPEVIARSNWKDYDEDEKKKALREARFQLSFPGTDTVATAIANEIVSLARKDGIK